jgi:hypothetical protein
MPTVKAYQALVGSWYSNLPKFMQVVANYAQPYVDAQTLLTAMEVVFDLETAVGAQLDAVGVRVGISRFVNIPLPDAYFSWGVTGLGWNQGVWKGEFDPSTGTAALDDYHYRIVLIAKVAANQWNGTVASAITTLSPLFADTGSLVIVEDNMDMSMTVAVAGNTPTPTMWALLISGLLDLKPGAVQIRNYLVASVPGPLFGWGVENQYISGWGVGAWGATELPVI